MISDIRLIPLTFRLEPSDYDLIVKQSQQNKVSKATVIRAALEQYFQEDNNNL